MKRFSSFFAAYNASVKSGNPLSKEEQVNSFTNGRTESLKDLSASELAELTRQLNTVSGFTPNKPDQDKADIMRKAIISIFYKMGASVSDAKGWAEKQGVKGQKRAFNDYSTGELYVLIQIAEKALRDQQAAIRKSLCQ